MELAASDATTTNLNANCSLCRDMCKSPDSNETVLYYFIALLSIIAAGLALTSVFFLNLYKRERRLRLTMWNVKTEDIRVDKMQWHPVDTPKSLASNSEMAPSKRQIAGKRAKHFYTTTGHYQGRLVAVQQFRPRRMSLDKPSLCDLDQVFMINHEHLCKFYGSNHVGPYVTVLTEYCTRGSLQDLLDEQSDWDDVFKNSLIFDIVQGMLYLHQTIIGSHGNLKPSNCLIDSRFMVKITDFGAIGQRLKVRQNTHRKASDPVRKKFWTAPELLRAIIPPQEGTKKGDVYSFAIIAQEILYQRGVFYRRYDNFTAEEIIQRVASPKSEDEIFRPSLEDDDDVIIHEQWRKTLRKCWSEKAKDRLDFHEIFQVAIGLQTDNTLIDSLLQRLQKYTNLLEEKVEEKTEQYKAEKERSDSLLYQMLPKSVANRLKINTDVMPESYDKVTVYFSDIVGFSAICHKSQPLEVVQMLNDLYTMFDQIIDEFDVYKVETIGDAYMVVSGLPIRNGNKHAREIAKMAIRLRNCVSNDFVIKHLPNVKLKLRVGIHTGPVVAGVVGLKMPRYCLFGDTVNTAARMEQNGKELKIHISPHTKEVLDEFGTFNLRKRRKSVTLKGLGEWNTWWLVGEKCNVSYESPDTLPAVVDLYVTGYNDTVQPKQSVSSTVSNASESALLDEDSSDYNEETVFDAESKTSTHRSTQNYEYESKRKRTSNTAIPARYRPSCLANQKKQRRNGSAVIAPLNLLESPLLSDEYVGNSVLGGDINQNRNTDSYTTIGAIFMPADARDRAVVQ